MPARLTVLGSPIRAVCPISGLPAQTRSPARQGMRREPRAARGARRAGRVACRPMSESALDVERLVTGAHDATGLDDFGATEWRDGLEHLVDSLHNEARLHELGEQ